MKKLTIKIKYIVYFIALATIFPVIILPSSAYAAKKRQFPLGCRPQGFRFEYNVLQLTPNFTEKKQQQTLYFMHNTTDQIVELIMKKPHGQKFGPDYKNAIQPHSWAVFALDFKHFEFTCSDQNSSDSYYSGYGRANCSDLLKVCEYNNAKFAPHNMGTYWTVKTAERKDAVRGAIKSGILLRS